MLLKFFFFFFLRVNIAHDNLGHPDNIDFFHCSKLVLVAIQDEGSAYILPAIPAFKRLGAINPEFYHRGSFAFVAYALAKRPTGIAQEQQIGGRGPSEINLKIPLTQSQPGKDA